MVKLNSDPAGSGFVDGNIIKVGATLPATPSWLGDTQLMPGTTTTRVPACHGLRVGGGEIKTLVAG